MDERAADDLVELLRDPGFTPSARRAAELARLAASPEVQRAALAALVRVQGPIARRVGPVFAELAGDARAALLDALRRRAVRDDDDELARVVAPLASAPHTRTARAATRLLADLHGASAETALRDALACAAREDDRRAIVRALARRGATLDQAERASVEQDPVAARLRVIGARDRARPAGPAAPVAAFEVPEGSRIVWRCRVGLESILEDEVRARLRARARDVRAEPGLVTAAVAGPSAQLDEPRCAIAWGFDIGAVEASDLTAELARVLDGAARPLFDALGLARPRFRLELTDARGRETEVARDLLWKVAERFAAHAPDGPINDPTRAELTLVAQRTADGHRLLLMPARVDTRFAYRVAEVPAASHPTIAAALARASSPRDDDVVWDPFVGSGLELCERALLGAHSELVGTDVDAAALAKARANLERVPDARFTLLQADARAFDARRPSVILTNPPLGRRVASPRALPALFEGLAERIVALLTARGRVAMICPLPAVMRTTLQRAGLEETRCHAVDMGGFDASLQVFARPRDAKERAGRRGPGAPAD